MRLFRALSQTGRAALAQLVEQFIRNEKVDSSIPSSGTILIQQISTQKPHPAAFFTPVWCLRRHLG